MGGDTRQPSPVVCLYSRASTTMRNTGLRFLLPYMRPYSGALLLGTLYAIIAAGASEFIYIWRFYSAGFQMSMHALLLLLIGSGLMALTSPLLAAVVVVMLAISVLAQVRLSRVLERSFDKVQQELAHLAAFAQEY